MTDVPLHLAVVVGSNRDGRFSPVVARWVVEQARRRDDLTIDLLDLAELELPAVMPSRADDAVDAFARRLDAADAFVVVTPEYNHSYPAVLKHAIDLTGPEWRAKPVAFVSLGGVSGGLRAVEHLRLVFAEMRAVTMRESVSFHRVARANFEQVARGAEKAARVQLDELVWWARALRAARNETPYPRAS